MSSPRPLLRPDSWRPPSPLNYGVSQYLPAGPGLVELGVLGYSQWQVTQDSGADVSRFNRNQDQVHGIGAGVPWAAAGVEVNAGTVQSATARKAVTATRLHFAVRMCII